MKLASTTRVMILACFAAAPVLGGADGGCGSGPVSIGGDDRDQGSGGGGSGTPCGPTHCGAGLECCNESCGICVAPGEGCRAIGCVDPCGAQDAAGVGACDMHLGYRWNGSSCEPLGGCSCEGAACEGLFASAAECQSRHSNCNGGGSCSEQDQAIFEYLSAHRACNSAADCRTVTIGCTELAGSCAGAFFTNKQVDDAHIAELQAALNQCATGDPATGCGVCAIGLPPPDCVDGVCTGGSFGGSCQAEQSAVESYLGANASCSEDDDCQIVDATCTDAAVNCSGAFYANQNVDPATLAALRAELLACLPDNGQSCSVVCDIAVPQPACVGGRCAPSGSTACPPVATSCDAGCYPMMARAYDPASGCLAQGAVVGCTPSNVGTTDLVCVRREHDGALFMGLSGSPFRSAPSGWSECTSDEAAAVFGAPECRR